MIEMCVCVCACVCMRVCACVRACVCVTYGDTLVFDMYVSVTCGFKGHASNPTPVYKDIHCSVATGLIYVVL